MPYFSSPLFSISSWAVIGLPFGIWLPRYFEHGSYRSKREKKGRIERKKKKFVHSPRNRIDLTKAYVSTKTSCETSTRHQSPDRTRPTTTGNVAKLVDRLSKDFGAVKPTGTPPSGMAADVSLRKEKASKQQRARVRFSYSPKHDDELQLEVEDLIENVEEAEEGWLKGKLRGKVGLFPANFVEVTTVLGSAPLAQEEDTKAAPLEQNGAGDSSSEPSVIQPKKVKRIGFGVDILGGGAVNLRATKPTGNKGEERKTTIEFVEKDGSTKKQTATTSLSSESLGPKGSSGKDTREFARVEFAYEPTNDDELKLDMGDIVTVLSKESEDPGWWYGEVNGRRGVFPDNFVKTLAPDQVPKERKTAPSQPPAVPAKPKPSAGSLGRSTTPEPHKQDKGAAVDLGPKSNSLKNAATASSNLPMSTGQESKKEESHAPERPKKPAFPSLAAGLAKPKTTSATPSVAKPSLLSSESLQKTGSDHTDEGTDALPSVESERLPHPTASRPKHPNKRPPSQVFLAQMGGKDPSPTKEEQSPALASPPSSSSSVLPSKKPAKPPPPNLNTAAFSLSHTDSASESTQKFRPGKIQDEEGETNKTTVSTEEFRQLKSEFEAYRKDMKREFETHRKETAARIAKLEAHVAKLTQGTGDKL